MFVVLVDFVVTAEDRERFLELLTTNAQASVAQEAGCLQFDVCTEIGAPGHVFLYEVYEDAAAFEAHKQTPHFEVFDRESRGLFIEKRVRCLLRNVAAREDPSITGSRS